MSCVCASWCWRSSAVCLSARRASAGQCCSGASPSIDIYRSLRTLVAIYRNAGWGCRLVTLEPVTLKICILPTLVRLPQLGRQCFAEACGEARRLCESGSSAVPGLVLADAILAGVDGAEASDLPTALVEAVTNASCSCLAALESASISGAMAARLAVRCLVRLPLESDRAASVLRPLRAACEAATTGLDSALLRAESVAASAKLFQAAGAAGAVRKEDVEAWRALAESLVLERGSHHGVLLPCAEFFSASADLLSAKPRKKRSAVQSGDAAAKRQKRSAADTPTTAARAACPGAMLSALMSNLGDADVELRLATWRLLGSFDQPTFLDASTSEIQADVPTDFISLGLKMDSAPLDPSADLF